MTCMQVHLDGGRGLILRGKHGVERMYMLYHFFFEELPRVVVQALVCIFASKVYTDTEHKGTAAFLFII